MPRGLYVPVVGCHKKGISPLWSSFAKLHAWSNLEENIRQTQIGKWVTKHLSCTLPSGQEHQKQGMVEKESLRTKVMRALNVTCTLDMCWHGHLWTLNRVWNGVNNDTRIGAGSNHVE